MEAWQSQQRAQKQKDRQEKNESAQILQNYRGSIKEEDALLRKIRLEDEQKRKEAQANLQSYKGQADGIEKVKSPKNNAHKYDGPLPEMVAPLGKDDPANTITVGAVSSIAANFTATNLPAEVQSKSISPSAPSAVPDATATTSEVTSSSSEEKKEATINEAISNEQVDNLESRNSHSNNSSFTQDWVKVTSEEVPLAFDYGTTTSADEEPKQSVMQRLDVDFSFGLISTRSSPSFKGYMDGVADVLTTALEENSGKMKQLIQYDPQYMPYVEKVAKDGMYPINWQTFRLVAVPAYLSGIVFSPDYFFHSSFLPTQPNPTQPTNQPTNEQQNPTSIQEVVTMSRVSWCVP